MTVAQTNNQAYSEATPVAYSLEGFAQHPEALVLVVGFGNPMKSTVKAAAKAGITNLWVTGTEDKRRAFSCSGDAQVICLGSTFDERLFTNEYAVLTAAQTVEAQIMLWVAPEEPSLLLLTQAHKQGMQVMLPMPEDKTDMRWITCEVATQPESIKEVRWHTCPKCKLNHDYDVVMAAQGVCPTCNQLYRLTSEERIALHFDADTFEEWDVVVEEPDPLNFPGYEGVLEKQRSRSGREEAVTTGKAQICGFDVAVCVMESTFMMGSMGQVVGEKITRAVERATQMGLPLIIFTASGGARMQEGLVSLMQMAKVSAAIEAHGRAGLLYVSVITDPTTGGVTASFAMEGDVIISEPHALIGFAGRRVIQDTIKQTLPDDFQTAEFALEHGLIDAIVERSDVRQVLGELVELHAQPRIKSAADTPLWGRSFNRFDARSDASPNRSGILPEGHADVRPDSTTMKEHLRKAVAQMSEAAANRANANNATTSEAPGFFSAKKEAKAEQGKKGFFRSLYDAVTDTTERVRFERAMQNQYVADAPSVKLVHDPAPSDDSNKAWESVQLARNVHRPTASYYINYMVDDFIELHGDRSFADDGAIIAGVGYIDGMAVTVIAQEKGCNLHDRIARNFGCPQPEGYRKSLRLMKQAEKFGRPIVCLVDTQGAFCGKEAEERGVGNALADNLMAMAGLQVPIVSVVLGEGGSGGALALATSNCVAMQEYAVYSVLSPEGFASILWKDGSRAAEAAAVMKMSAREAHELGIIEAVLPEGYKPAHENPQDAAQNVQDFISIALKELSIFTGEELRTQRYERFRKF